MSWDTSTSQLLYRSNHLTLSEHKNENFQSINKISIQLNSCNSNSCNLKYHLNQTNSLVSSEFTSKHLHENSFNSNSRNPKNYLNRTFHWVPWTYFSSCNSNFGFEVKFFHPLITYCSKFECFSSDAMIFECLEIFKVVWIQLLVAEAIKMAAKEKHYEVALKIKYEALK